MVRSGRRRFGSRAVSARQALERNDVQRVEQIDIPILIDHGYFKLAEHDELGVRHGILPAVRGAQNEGLETPGDTFADLLDVHGKNEIRVDRLVNSVGL